MSLIRVASVRGVASVRIAVASANCVRIRVNERDFFILLEAYPKLLISVTISHALQLRPQVSINFVFFVSIRSMSVLHGRE